jgi:hypothetical protein
MYCGACLKPLCLPLTRCVMWLPPRRLRLSSQQLVCEGVWYPLTIEEALLLPSPQLLAQHIVPPLTPPPSPLFSVHTLP